MVTGGEADYSEYPAANGGAALPANGKRPPSSHWRTQMAGLLQRKGHGTMAEKYLIRDGDNAIAYETGP